MKTNNSIRKGRKALPALMLAAIMIIALLLPGCNAGSAGKADKQDAEATPFLPGISGSIELPDDDFTDNTPLPEPTQAPTEVPEEFFESRTYSFIDDAALFKICGRSEGKNPDVSREGVQRDLLPLIEGTTVTTKHGMVKTDHILFITSGAFHISKPSDAS